MSSESGPAKGVLTSSTARHICYCHTPMRYLWDLYPAYRNEFTRLAMEARRHDAYLELSAALGLRIGRARRSFRRQQRQCAHPDLEDLPPRGGVVYPPVDVESFYWKPAEDYFLIVSELVPYKRIDTAVRLFSRNGRRLRIAGAGPEMKRLRRVAAPNVEFLGRVSDVELARALCPLPRTASARRRGLRHHAGGGAGQRQTSDRAWPRRRARDGTAPSAEYSTTSLPRNTWQPRWRRSRPWSRGSCMPNCKRMPPASPRRSSGARCR